MVGLPALPTQSTPAGDRVRDTGGTWKRHLQATRRIVDQKNDNVIVSFSP